MAQIKINNIIYGTSDATEIMYNNITVAEKLDTVPIFDIEDNVNVEEENNYLTYANIVDNLTSEANNKVLSAKQGKILNEKINNINNSINTDLSNVQDVIADINTNVSNNKSLIDNNTNSINVLNNNFSSLWKPVKYSITDSGSINLLKSTPYIIFAHGNHWGNYAGLYLLYTGASANITTVASCSHLTISYSDYVLTIQYDSYGGAVDIIQL